MKRNPLILLFTVFVSAGILGQSLILAEAGLETGKIIDRVICQHDKSQSYALFLPSRYTPEKKWPVIYAFDPAGRGVKPLRHFEPAAEEYGYILVCSYNSRNGPSEPVLEAIKAIWKDTLSRLALDRSRVYATGFSGGARVCSFFPLVISQPIQGIIACGAGLSVNLKPGYYKFNAYYGIVGINDFNYQELQNLGPELDKAGIINHMAFYDGHHQWPPQALCTRAVEWLELVAMKRQLRKKAPALIHRVYGEELSRAKEFETKSDLFFAINTYESILLAFKDLEDLSGPREKLARLKQEKAFKKFQKEEEKRKKKENEITRQFMGIFAYIVKTGPPLSELNKILTALKVTELLKKSRKKGDIYESGVNSRLLTTLGNHANEEGKRSLQQGEYTRAILFFEISSRARQDTFWYPYDLYDLACSYAMNKDSKKALKYLRQAVEAGFDQRDYMESDSDLESLRETAEFKEILSSMDQKTTSQH
jgi:tetratricopeptide (TPR) repeat protein